MPEEIIPPVEEVTPVSTEETPETPESTPETITPPEDEGQEKPGDSITDDPIVALATKKGWDPKQAPTLLAKAYTELESKLGNYKDVEKRASLYEAAQKKAELWDAAQRYIESQDADGAPDLSKMSTEDLASLWENGQIGLADMPADKQFAVQRYVNSSQTAADSAVTSQAAQLVKDNPILNDPEVLELVATKIENGVESGEAIRLVKSIMQKGEKTAEERLKKDTEMIKNGNLEAGGSPARTTPQPKITTVREAFLAAKAEIASKGQ
jgi:hypothetical protein